VTVENNSSVAYPQEGTEDLDLDLNLDIILDCSLRFQLYEPAH